MGNLNSFQARFVALRQSLIDDGIRLGVPFSGKDLQTIIERLQAEGSSFVKVTLPLLGKALDQGLVCGTFKNIPHFSLKRNTRLPTFCHSVFREIFGSDGDLRSDANTTCIHHLRQFLLFDSKVISTPTEQQKVTAIEDFKTRQSALRGVRLDTGHPVLLRAQWLLTRVLKRCDLSDILPGHGPGIVSEGYNRFERWDFSSWPYKAEREYPFGVYGTHSFRAIASRGIGVPLIRNKVTKCCLVPKDFRGPRLISAESTATQYLQQGQMRSLMSYIDSHPILSRSICLRDQTHNQKKASEAYDNDQVTLDLSNASDTVSVAVVWYLLSGVPKLRRQLMSTRSDYMRYNNEYVRISAFAPMGSAVCFPVETLVFWAISMASLMLVRPVCQAKRAALNKGFTPAQQPLRELASLVSVFGDDIIVPSDCFETLVSTLSHIGCSVNKSKTCYATPFRESCGSDWFGKHDVTIIRNRRYTYDNSRDVRDYPVLSALQRKFFLHGFYKTAELLSTWVREIRPTVTVSLDTLVSCQKMDLDSTFTYPRTHPTTRYLGSRTELGARFADRQSFVGSAFWHTQSLALDRFPALLGWHNDTDCRCEIRWNGNLQRREFRVPVEFQPQQDWTTEEGYGRLFARLSTDSVERIAIRDRKVKMAWSYLPF